MLMEEKKKKTYFIKVKREKYRIKNKSINRRLEILL